ERRGVGCREQVQHVPERDAETVVPPERRAAPFVIGAARRRRERERRQVDLLRAAAFEQGQPAPITRQCERAPRAQAEHVRGLAVRDGEMGTLELHVGAATVMLYPKPDHQPASFTVLNFPVDDIDAEVERLAAVGVSFERYDGKIRTDAKGIARGPGPEIA